MLLKRWPSEVRRCSPIGCRCGLHLQRSVTTSQGLCSECSTLLPVGADIYGCASCSYVRCCNLSAYDHAPQSKGLAGKFFPRISDRPWFVKLPCSSCRWFIVIPTRFMALPAGLSRIELNEAHKLGCSRQHVKLRVNRKKKCLEVQARIQYVRKFRCLL